MKSLGWTIIALCIISAAVSRAEAPLWSKGPTVKRIDSNTVIVTCEGKGPSRGLSYREAQQSCAALASDQKANTIKVSQVVIESENEPAKLYSSVESSKQVSGLTGKTENELTVESDIGFVTYLQVRYDLRNIGVASTKEDDDKSTTDAPLMVSPKEKVSSDIERKGLVTDATRSITVQLSDRCADYIVKGSRPRSHSCGNSNVIQVMVNAETDQEVIFRPADSHFLPAMVKVNRGRIPAEESEVLDVQFQRSK